MYRITNFLRENEEKILYIILTILLFALASETNYHNGYYIGFQDGKTVGMNYITTIEKENNSIPIPTVTPVPTPIEEQFELPVEYDEEELKYLSSIIWCEAGNQCDAGQQAVGIVVANRVDNEKYANTVREVIYEKGQFTPAHNGNLNKALAAYDAGTLSQNSIDAAKYVLDGNRTVSYNGANIDMTPYLYFNGSLNNAEIRIQDHDFK